MYLATCDVAWTQSAGTAICNGTLSLVDTSTLIPAFTMADIDMILAGQVFASSFIVIGMFSVAATALRALLKTVKGRF